MASGYVDLDRPPLHAGALRAALLTPGALWTELDVLPQTTSTNAVLRDRALRGRSSGLVVFAEHQTAGRGRLERTWTAPPRSGLTMSALIRPDDVAVANWSWIGLAAGLAVAAAVRDVAAVPAELKWPNDVVVDDRKLGGILVERVEAAPYPAAAVIGIGLNVSLRRAELPVPTATSLALEGAATTDRSLLARAILRLLEGVLGDWQHSGGEPSHGLRLAYTQACSTIGRRVRLELPDGTNAWGEAVGVDGSGRLLVATCAGQEAFSAGDVLHLTSLPDAKA